jgi:hypothetical protein
MHGTPLELPQQEGLAAVAEKLTNTLRAVRAANRKPLRMSSCWPAVDA